MQMQRDQVLFNLCSFGCIRFHESCIIYILAQSCAALKELLIKNDVASQLVV